MADAGCDVTVWGRDETVCRQIADEHRNEAYLPGVELPARVTATTDARAALAGADIVAVAIPSQSARATLDAAGRRRRPARRRRLADEGRRAVDRPPDERGRRGVPRHPGGPRRRRLRPEPGARDRAPAADRDRRRVDGRGDRAAGGPGVRVVVLPAVHQRRRRRRRAVRRREERHRAGRRHLAGPRAGLQHDGDGHHARPRRDHAARPGARRRRRHVPGPRRPGRPHGDVRVARLAQPHARRAHRPRHDARRGDRRDRAARPRA